MSGTTAQGFGIVGLPVLWTATHMVPLAGTLGLVPKNMPRCGHMHELGTHGDCIVWQCGDCDPNVRADEVGKYRLLLAGTWRFRK